MPPTAMVYRSSNHHNDECRYRTMLMFGSEMCLIILFYNKQTSWSTDNYMAYNRVDGCVISLELLDINLSILIRCHEVIALNLLL